MHKGVILGLARKYDRFTVIMRMRILHRHQLTVFPLVQHIYASVNQVSIGSDNGLSPIRRQAIIWTSAWLLSIGPSGTNFSEILIKIQNFLFTKMHLKILFAKRRPFCPGGDELSSWLYHDINMFSESQAPCEGNPLLTGGFPSQKANNKELWYPLCLASTSRWTNDSGWRFDISWCSSCHFICTQPPAELFMNPCQ